MGLWGREGLGGRAVTPVAAGGSDDSGRRRHKRVLWGIVGAHFAVMFLLAFLLPARLQDMPWVLPLVELTREWAPTVALFARRAADPGLFEAHMSIALALAVVALLLGLLLIRPGYSEMRFYGTGHKMLLVGAATAMVALLGAYFFLPSMADGKAGLLQGRAGAFMQLTLSGRVGLALFPLFSSSALLLAFLLLWVAIREPVRSYAELVFPSPTKD